MMKSWNVRLIFITFLLTTPGTMLTRGGLVTSVHAFAGCLVFGASWFLRPGWESKNFTLTG